MHISSTYHDSLFPGGNQLFWLITVLTLGLSLQKAIALNPGDVTIENRSGPSFLLDANNPCGEGPEASYVAYRVCNTSGTSLSNLTVELSGLSTGFSLLNGQDALQETGTLEPGECKMIFWYIGFPCTFGQTTTVQITATDTNPGSVTFSNTVTTTSNLTASAGGLLIGMTPGPELQPDSTSWIDVEYEFGNIPKNGIAYFQPAGNLDFDAGCLQLTGFEVMTSGIPAIIPPGTTDALYYTASAPAGGGEHRVTVRYYFRVDCASLLTTLYPFAAATSGIPVKYSSNYSTVRVEAPDDFIPPPVPCSGSPDYFAMLMTGTGTGLESSGNNWSASWADYNGDNLPDLFVTTYNENQPNALYRNEGNGSFTRITSGPIGTDMASSVSAAWGDYDNDGDPDLYVGNNIGYANFLYRNEGNGSFTKIQNDPSVSYTGYSHGVSWADYDNDGFLDLFVATYWETTFNLLYHNNGDGTFSAVSNNAIANEASRSVAGTWADYNNDGFQDLFVTNTAGQNNSLYRNQGNGNFQKITTGAIVNDGGNSVGASWGDYNNDGFPDLFVANAGNENNFLYKNNGNGTFSKITQSPVTNSQGHSHGSAWADYDNDGDLDLFVTNDGQPNSIYRNNGDESFTAIENEISQGNASSFGAAWADYDNDGDLDLFVANRNGEENLLYENTEGQCNHWSCIRLSGTNTNASAFGTKIRIYATINGQPRMQMRELSSQTGGGTGGQNELTVRFGLGDATLIDSIVLNWPSGYSQTLTSQPADQCLTITEDNASEVCGTVYHDANGNCIRDETETGIPDVKILLQPGNLTAYTDEEGNYSLFVKPGSYVISEFPGLNWAPICPNPQGSAPLQVSGIGNQYCGNYFGNTAVCPFPDLHAATTSTAHRIASENLMVVNYGNSGTAAGTGTVLTLSLPTSVQLNGSSLPFDTRNGNEFEWNLGEVLPGQKGAIYLTYEVLQGTNIGEAIAITASIEATEDDCSSDNDNFTETAMAVSAFDPNDILVQPEGAVKEDEWIQYKIRFQNVGNAPASFIRVEDAIPAELDLSTLEPGTVSHTYRFHSDGRNLIWEFPNIDLPDSLSNEPGSHGFIVFRIKPKSTLKAGDRISNQAAIYFDNNPPIITNIVENYLDKGSVRRQSILARPLLIHPNPARSTITAQSMDLLREPDVFFTDVRVLNLLGKAVLIADDIQSHRVELQVEQVPAGTYIVKARDNRDRIYTGKVIVAK